MVYIGGVLVVGALASGGGLSGLATGGQGCGDEPPVLTEIDEDALLHEEDCDLEAVRTHPDRLAVLQEQVDDLRRGHLELLAITA